MLTGSTSAWSGTVPAPQAALYYRAHDASAVNAVVSLDTTQDYHSTSSGGWELLVTYLIDHVENMDGPVLVAANEHAIFQLMDAMVQADRSYLLTRELDHNDFIAQGIARKLLECRAKPDDRAVESAYRVARAQYEEVCRRTLAYFDAHLKKDNRRQEELDRPRPNGDPRPSVVRVPRGTSGPEPFRLESQEPPTPRQIRELMSRIGVERSLQILDRCHEANPHAPVFHGDLGFALAEEFLELGRISDARAVRRVYDRYDPTNARGYFRAGQALREARLQGRRDRAVSPGAPDRPRRCRGLGEAQSPGRGDEGAEAVASLGGGWRSSAQITALRSRVRKAVVSKSAGWPSDV